MCGEQNMLFNDRIRSWTFWSSRLLNKLTSPRSKLLSYMTVFKIARIFHIKWITMTFFVNLSRSLHRNFTLYIIHLYTINKLSFARTRSRCQFHDVRAWFVVTILFVQIIINGKRQRFRLLNQNWVYNTSCESEYDNVTRT